MQINLVLCRAVKLLEKAHLDSPALDARIILSTVMSKDQVWILSHSESKISGNKLKKFQRLLARRVRREPLAYIIGKKEFCGRQFIVNKDVLIPRPATEILVSEALKYLSEAGSSRVLKRRGDIPQDRRAVVLDVGTGSGCIAITITKELEKSNSKNIKIFATDTSSEALAIAKHNARKYRAKITFRRGNLLLPFFFYTHRSVRTENLILTANLPYLTPQEWRQAQPEIKKYEPRSALVGGKDGLKYYWLLLRQLYKSYKSNKSNKIKIVCFFEINPRQKRPLSCLIKNPFPDARIEFIKDLGGSVRICKAELKMK